MIQELPKAYNPKEVEDKIYEKWEKSGYFNPDNLPCQVDKCKGNFSISMPPPNATGVLHTGHAVMLAIQDIIIRWRRMQGFKTLWLPGTDHAAIATSSVVEKKLWEEKKLTRYDLGREKFLAEVERFVEQSKSIIRNQIRKMGSSCDWSREAYTLDALRTKAVRQVFKMMYDDGLIYRGERIVNWCPRCASTLADDEVEYKTQKIKLYTFKYSKDFPFAIATTRPETKLGDTAVAVNPNDARYKKYIGKTFEINFVGVPLKLKVIADESIDMEFGTGALGVTPAHSMVDWQMAEKNNLPIIKVIDEQGKIREGFPNYSGKTAAEARELIVERLKENDLLLKEEEIESNLSVCYRCGSIIEPLPSLQWFIDVDKKIPKYKKSLKELSIEAVKKGIFGYPKIKIIPKRFEKIYFHWMENLRDWCISRQIWFGHRLPVYYCKQAKSCNSVFVSVDEPQKCPKCGSTALEQDPDTLDTWFSSSLWTFSTLLDKNFKKYKTWKEWIKYSKDLQTYHPTSVMETGYDLIFFWIARMILMTVYALGEIPFKTVYLHGLVLDKYGEKMSKSKPETCIDPLDVCQKYGTDAVRLSLVLGTSPGNDFRLYDEKIAGFRNFTNKLWNIGRYVIEKSKVKSQKSKINIKNLMLAERWILSRLNTVVEEVTNHLEKFEFSQAGEKLRSFTWDEFADWYLEINKIQPNNFLLLNSYLIILKLWHPFMPYVTEELWSHLNGSDKLLMVSEWPKPKNNWHDSKAEKDFEVIKNVITAIRAMRADYKIEPAKKISVVIYGGAKTKLLKEQVEIIKSLARVEKVEIKPSGKKPSKSAGAVISGVELYLPLAGLINFEKERERLQKELVEAEEFLKSVREKLANKKFLLQAPKEVVEKEKEKEKVQKERIRKIKKQLKGLE